MGDHLIGVACGIIKLIIDIRLHYYHALFHLLYILLLFTVLFTVLLLLNLLITLHSNIQHTAFETLPDNK